ncbi:MAG: 4Fe-4S binding protein [Desulfobacterales bacterium]
MKKNDYYEDLCRFYEIFVGKIPDRIRFKEALKQTVSENYLETYFLIPASGGIPFAKLLKKSDLFEDDLKHHLHFLASEGFILLYRNEKGLFCERGNPVFMAEQQVRKPEASRQKTVFAEFFNHGIEGQLEEPIETKTPYFRVIPSEPTITSNEAFRKIDIDVSLPPPGEVLPIDKITEMIKNEAKLIGVAKCFCRAAKRHLGEGCGHPMETCLAFNELAQTLIEHGFAREIDYEEAIQIIQDCDKEGLVHNIDNCSKNIRTLCNCCSCCCILIKSLKRGESFAGAPSRYLVQFDQNTCSACFTCISRCPTAARRDVDGALFYDPDRCIGCGLCVTTCPTGSNEMVLRNEKHKIPASYRKLSNKIRREAVFSIVKKKISKKRNSVHPEMG